MFESDDFDQVLSQFDFPEVPKATNNKENVRLEYVACKSAVRETQPTTPKRTEEVPINSCISSSVKRVVTDACKTRTENETEVASKSELFITPKHTKRKIISSYFDHQNKRKFPGPAGLLTGALEEPKDDNICQMELLSQDIDCTQHNLHRDLFESSLWNKLLADTQSWKLHDIDSIKQIKQQALSGNLRRRKAQTVTAFIEAVDRSAIDPLIILRDYSGYIKCTLHRDAWSTFAPYIVSKQCALVLWKPTVLTTGGAFKKHYLNITLSNILAVYSSNVLNEDGNKTLPDEYNVVHEDEFIVIKTDKHSNNSFGTSLEQSNGAEDLFDGLDNIFSDDIF